MAGISGFLHELVQDLMKKVDDLNSKVEEHHLETMDKLNGLDNKVREDIYNLERRVENHDKVFSVAKWVGSSGGLVGILIACKDWIFPQNH